MFVKRASGEVINTDDTYYKAIKAARESKSQVEHLEIQMNSFKTELTEIKNLLSQVLNR